jgi:NHL repeat/6-bladed beta-propeller
MGASESAYLYIVDSANNRVQAFTYDGVFKFSWGTFGSGNGQFNNPYGVCTNGNEVYVTDSGNNRVQVFDKFGNYLFQWGTLGVSDGQFNNPLGVATDGILVYVVDSSNNRFQMFGMDGTFLAALGSFGAGFNQFNHPTNIWVDSVNITIYDSGNNRLVVYPKALFGFSAAIRLPMLTMSGSFYGHWWQASVTFPMLKMSGSFTGNGVFAGSAAIPMLKMLGTFVAHGSMSGNAMLPMLKMSGAFTAVVNFKADLLLPMVTFSGEMTANGIFSANITIPMLTMSGVFSAVLAAVYHAIAINTEIAAVTEYTNYPFNSMCEFNGKYYASGPSGVTRLDGVTDLSNSPIVPTVRFSTNDLHRGGVKNFIDSYFTGRTNDKTTAKMIYDEDEISPNNTFITEIPDPVSSQEAVRVQPPKGMKKKRFVTVEIQNADEIDEYRIIVEPIPGRVR